MPSLVEVDIEGGTVDSPVTTDRLPDGARIVGRVLQNGDLFLSVVNVGISLSVSGKIDSTGQVTGEYFFGDTVNTFVGSRLAEEDTTNNNSSNNSGSSSNNNSSSNNSGNSGNSSNNSGSNSGSNSSNNQGSSGSNNTGNTNTSQSVEHILCAEDKVGRDDPLYCRTKNDGCIERGIFSSTADPQIDISGKYNDSLVFDSFEQCLTACLALEFKTDPNAGTTFLGFGDEFAECKSKN